MKESWEDLLLKNQLIDLWAEEQKISEIYNVNIMCGVDEAGRGPLAGPVYAAAVILPVCIDIPGLNDSKKLSESSRVKLYDVITASALSYSVAFATVEEIESLNILEATYIAMNRAISGLTIKPQLALIDGNRNKGIECNSVCVVKGDSKCADIAAASILAKVSRDRYMLELAKEYPEYRFEKHKGYGTELHYEMLRKYGPSPAHRMSFLRKMH